MRRPVIILSLATATALLPRAAHADEAASGRLRTEAMLAATPRAATPASRSRSDAGLNLGIAGTALATMGVLLVASAAYYNGAFSVDCGLDDCRSSRTVAFGIGVPLIVLGAVLTPFGWSRYRSAPRVVVHDARASAPRSR